MKLFNYGEFQFDVLKEVGNIGAGNATTALSKLISKEIDMKVPLVNIVSFDDIANFVGGDEMVVVSVYLRILGDVPGNMFFIMSVDAAKSLVKELTGIQPSQGDFSDMELSAISEMGNILIGSYLSSLADFTKLNMQPSVPSVAIDMAGAVLSHGLIEASRSGDYALAIDTEFLEGNEQVNGHFFLLPNPNSLEKLFSALGVPVE